MHAQNAGSALARACIVCVLPNNGPPHLTEWPSTWFVSLADLLNIASTNTTCFASSVRSMAASCSEYTLRESLLLFAHLTLSDFKPIAKRRYVLLCFSPTGIRWLKMCSHVRSVPVLQLTACNRNTFDYWIVLIIT